MPIGKDSIKTRVAKVSAEAVAPAVDLPAEPAPVEVAEPVAEAKPATTATTPKKRTTGTATATKKKPAAPKAEKATAETAAEPTAEQPATAVLSNVTPETVEAVVGHKEGEKVEHVQVGQKMPNYLL